MPSINKLTIKGFKAFPKKFVLNLNGRNLLMYGENGSGKSSIYYALHCIFQSPLKRDVGKKYFNEYNSDGSINAQHLKNLNNLIDDASIKIDFTDNHPFIYEVNKDGYNTTLIGGVHPLPADITGVFINHKFLFHFFSFRNSEQINLFPVFEKDIFPFVKDEKSGLHIGEMYDELTSSVIKKGKRISKDYLNNIEYFNLSVRNIIEEINIYASDNYNNYFRDNGDNRLKIRLRYDSNEERRPKDHNEYWLKYDNILETFIENGEKKSKKSSYKKYNQPFIGLEVNEIIDDNNERPIYKPQAYFNEAKLTAIALSIRFALENLDKPADGRFLALDDMLISLDMSNRTKVIDFLLKISDKYKIYLFTHDRVFFELFKDVIKAKVTNYKEVWSFKELYNDENNLENPECFDSEDSYTRAIYHLKNFDYPASANYLRKAVEELMLLFPPYISKNDNGTDKEKLRAKIDSAKNVLECTDGDIADIQRIIFSLGTLLNPLSHRSIDTNIYRTELKTVMEIIPRLRQHVFDLNIKEVVALENDVILFMDETENKKCEIRVRLRTPLYSYLAQDGTRKLSIAKGETMESVTIENGIRKAPKPFKYCPNTTLEEICKKLHKFLGKDYMDNYMDFYKDQDGNSFNTLL